MIKKDLESRAGFGTNLRVYETGLYNATHRDVSAALQAGHRLAEQRQITRDLDLTLAESYWFNLYK
ncbi:MAG: hypothetical protein Q7S55_01350 [Nanoarchaeota archaeon]|nr:hypothetical protein [Nanoarchaeota archaeon]